MRCVRNEHASTISTSTSTWNWIKCVSATVHVCCVCCRAKSTPIFRLFEGRDSTRLHSALTWTLQFRKRFLFRSLSCDCGGKWKNRFFRFCRLVLPFDGLPVVHAFYSFSIRRQWPTVRRVRDHSFNIFNGKCRQIFSSLSLPLCPLLAVGMAVISSAISSNTLRKRILENTIYINARRESQTIWCIEFNLAKTKIENFI